MDKWPDVDIVTSHWHISSLFSQEKKKIISVVRQWWTICQRRSFSDQSSYSGAEENPSMYNICTTLHLQLKSSDIFKICSPLFAERHYGKSLTDSGHNRNINEIVFIFRPVCCDGKGRLKYTQNTKMHRLPFIVALILQRNSDTCGKSIYLRWLMTQLFISFSITELNQWDVVRKV